MKWENNMLLYSGHEERRSCLLFRVGQLADRDAEFTEEKYKQASI